MIRVRFLRHEQLSPKATAVRGFNLSDWHRLPDKCRNKSDLAHGIFRVAPAFRVRSLAHKSSRVPAFPRPLGSIFSDWHEK
jgi:hypothetical protein